MCVYIYIYIVCAAFSENFRAACGQAAGHDDDDHALQGVEIRYIDIIYIYI